MREIKFRAWAYTQWSPGGNERITPEMIYNVQNAYDGSYGAPEGEEVTGGGSWESFGEVLREARGLESTPAVIAVMQFTGLKDKNGKEVYSGDICRFYQDPEEEFFFYGTAQVVDEQTGWAWKPIICEHILGKDQIDCSSFWNENFEVIGNIYENPEMLKESK